MLMAITREVSSTFQACELTHLDRIQIDVDRARTQHTAYEWALVEAGCTVRRLDSGPNIPDAVFVEDIAVVLDEGAVICRPGTESRRTEVPAIVGALASHGRPWQHITAPGTLDGGDVLVIGRRPFAGLSLLDIDPQESYGANALAIASIVVYPTTFPRTRERLERLGLRVRPVDELQKAEGAITYCSLIFRM